MEIFNRVKFATATTGTSDIAVGARAQGYLTPALAGVGNGDVVPYFIEDGDNFAHGVGTYSTTGPTLARDTNEVSFNGTTYAAGKLSLSGTAFVFIGLAATEIPFLTDGMLGIGKVPVTLIDIEGTDADIRLKNTASGYYWEMNTRNTGVFNIVSEQLGGNVIGLNGSGQFGIGSAVGSAGATAPRAAFDITESDSTVYNVGAGLDAFGEYGTMIVQNGSDAADTFTAISLYGGTNAASIGQVVLINVNGSSDFLSALALMTRDSGGGVSEKARVHSNGYFGINEKAPDYQLDVNGPFGFSPGASVTPVDNGDVVFEFTSNTALTLKAKGSDGTVRENVVPLAESGQTPPIITPIDGDYLQIASGAITVTGSYHKVDTEAFDASDDLVTINGYSDGYQLTIRPNGNGRTVVAKDGTGNLRLAGDCSLASRNDTLTLIYDSQRTAWLEISRSING